MKIIIETIDKKDARYATIGDYFYDDEGVLRIKVTAMDKRSSMLVIFHELIEQFITEDRSIKEEDIMAFDLEYEKNRKEGDMSEPGDSPNSPYNREHRFAENIERQIAHEIGYVWSEYDKVINEAL